ncbi:NAD-dependent epimerase/dehydratase [Micromonospora sp. WMMD998]|uniref:NAD-dependent epimerase/dehydratase family protein n=1 Tax=Micromonospora sp. WMMD998 TaxID=3016092 RepID=UPI00249B1253|nr:NAD-dependent epimerase/dehydratase [Micromonospora sp. WMMD998]WFE40987.1 NAD-dependent epimerase/dehydratase [Micromonospora sp. WMMD998]
MSGEASKQLVTVLGASGLLGTAITRQLARRPVRLRLVGRRCPVAPAGHRGEVETRAVDLTEPGAVADAVAGADVVVHLVAHMGGAGTWRVAATDPTAERVNLGLVHDLIGAVRAQRPHTPPVVLFAGSMSQAGRSAGRLDGTEPDRPLTAYDRHKLAAEQAIEEAHREGLLRGATLRLATLYSQGSDASALDRGVVASMTRRAFAGQPLTMWHDGSVTRDLLCVDDAAAAFLAAMDRPEPVVGRHWLVGTGQATSVAELFRAIAAAVARQSGRDQVPVVSVPPAEHSMPTDLLDFVLDPSAFQRATGWRPAVALPDGLRGMAAAVGRELAAADAA